LTIHSSSERPAEKLWRITGRAVVTTRLSRAAMNRAIELIANVHRTRCAGAGRARAIIVSNLCQGSLVTGR
jgi:DNA-binding MurR/RpiR family transcriptional regulator